MPVTLPVTAANGNALAKYLASRGMCVYVCVGGGGGGGWDFARTLLEYIRDQRACQNFARKFCI